MTKIEMENLIQRQLEAYNNRDLDSFCSCYHPDVQIHALIAGKVSCVGLAQFRSIYKALFESSPNLNCRLKNRIVLDSAVIDEEFVVGAAKYPNGAHAVAIYGFREGLIDRVWFPR